MVSHINIMPTRCVATLQKHLGYFNHIFRLSELHQCDQLRNANIGRLSWKSIEEIFFGYISLSLVSEDLFGYIPGIGNHSHATKELQ